MPDGDISADSRLIIYDRENVSFPHSEISHFIFSTLLRSMFKLGLFIAIKISLKFVEY